LALNIAVEEIDEQLHVFLFTKEHFEAEIGKVFDLEGPSCCKDKKEE
jgi:hypothetical protein